MTRDAAKGLSLLVAELEVALSSDDQLMSIEQLFHARDLRSDWQLYLRSLPSHDDLFDEQTRCSSPRAGPSRPEGKVHGASLLYATGWVGLDWFG